MTKEALRAITKLLKWCSNQGFDLMNITPRYLLRLEFYVINNMQ